MSTRKHYYIEERPDGRYAAKARGGERASGVFDSQHEAIRHVAQWNPDDHPDVERVRNTKAGDRGRWRPKDK